MNRRIRIGLIAEGEAELGPSVPYIKPEEGGKIIPRDQEGALHTLIRRELEIAGLPDCDFVQRHPSLGERRVFKLRTGHSVLDSKYLAQVVIAWKPEEIDMIVIVADADNELVERQRKLERALQTIRNNHLDENEELIQDRSAGGLAIRNFETWLLADQQTVTQLLNYQLELLENLEDLQQTKDLLDKAIENSLYLIEGATNQRSLQIRWQLAFKINLTMLKTCCPLGYGAFVQQLTTTSTVVATAIA